MTLDSHIWWYLARATGVVAWALATTSILWGMALSTRALGSRPSAPWLTDLHRFLGGLTVAATAGHLLALWADSYVAFGATELFVPLASAWRPWPIALGIVAMYGLAAVEVSSLAMRRLPRRWWRRIHLTSYLVWIAATAHLLMAGTDAANPLLLAGVWGSTAAIAFFTVYLVLGPRRRQGASRRRQPRPTPAGEVTASTPAPT